MYPHSTWLPKRLLASATRWTIFLYDNLQHRIWKVQVYCYAIWGNSCRRCLPVQAGWMFGHIPNVIVIADDIVVVGKQPNHKEHDQALTTLLETARQCNVRLNYEKLQYKQIEVEFFGETYTVNGCKPAKGKVQAIAEMSQPSCKKEVQSFIGMINYLSKFSARLPELALPIRELGKDKVPFNWGPEHQVAFKASEKWNNYHSNTGISWSKGNYCITNRWQY